MVPDTSQWRDEAAYDYLDHVPAAGFAWEWLRRNAHYQHDYQTLLREAPDMNELEEVIQRRWGLRFPGDTVPHMGGPARPLVGRESQRRAAARRGSS